MIDLHCHILPGIDDGAVDIEMSLQMARMLIDDGVGAVVCTPHILPGLYHNSGSQIRAATADLRSALARSGLRLELYSGADAHIGVDFVAKLKSAEILTLADSRYVLVELPQHVGPALLRQFFFQLMTAGYVPVLSHPERLQWIEHQYGVIENLVHAGVWIQITSGSLLGEFGRSARYWAERMLDEGNVHLLATDAHDAKLRPPNLKRGRDAAAQRVGEREANHLVHTRPLGILANEASATLLSTLAQAPNALPKSA
jgi:protein-tyrosine phosphatase